MWSQQLNIDGHMLHYCSHIYMLFNWSSTEFFNIITIITQLKYDLNSYLSNVKYPTAKQQGLNTFT